MDWDTSGFTDTLLSVADLFRPTRLHSSFALVDSSPRSSNFFPVNHVAWPRYTSTVKQPRGFYFAPLSFPEHISVLFSLGRDTSLLGTGRESGGDGRYPAESAVRCNKLMANPTRRRRQGRQEVVRGVRGGCGSCRMVDGDLAAKHINVNRKLVSGIGGTMLTSSDFP